MAQETLALPAGQPVGLTIRLRMSILRSAFGPFVSEGRTTSLRFCVPSSGDLLLAPIEGDIRPIATHDSLITAFLIDTPAIRIAPNSRLLQRAHRF